MATKSPTGGNALIYSKPADDLDTPTGVQIVTQLLGADIIGLVDRCLSLDMWR